MLDLTIEKIGELAVVECHGRIVRSDDAFKLRKAVMALPVIGVIVLDLSEVSAIEAGGLDMMLFLQRWACDCDIKLKLFNQDVCSRQAGMPQLDATIPHCSAPGSDGTHGERKWPLCLGCLKRNLVKVNPAATDWQQEIRGPIL